MITSEFNSIREKSPHDSLRNSRDLYFRLLNHDPGLPLPSVSELPSSLTLPSTISNIFINNLNATLHNNREYATFVDVLNGKEKETLIKAGKTTGPKLLPWLKALRQNTSAIFLHSHPRILGSDIPIESS